MLLLDVLPVRRRGFLPVNFARVNYCLEALGVGGAPSMQHPSLFL